MAKIKAGDRASSYAYHPKREPEFAAMNIQQQAKVVEDAFRSSRGGEAPHPAGLFTAASAHWRGD